MHSLRPGRAPSAQAALPGPRPGACRAPAAHAPRAPRAAACRPRACPPRTLPHASACAPASPACAPSLLPRPAQRPPSRHSCLSCDTGSLVSCHCTSQYKFYNTLFSLNQPPLAIHPTVLQYDFFLTQPALLAFKSRNTHYLTIQFLPSNLQYNFVLQLNLHYSCNIIFFFLQYKWAVAHSRFFFFCTNFFFSILTIIIIIIFNYFQHLKKFTKITKNHHFFFIFLDTQTNS